MKSVPGIVRIIITQANRWRAEGAISEAVFEQQIQRLAREELEPKGLTLLVRALPSRRTRFLIKEKATGTVCELMDFAADGRLEADAFETVGHPSRERSSAVASFELHHQTGKR